MFLSIMCLPNLNRTWSFTIWTPQALITQGTGFDLIHRNAVELAIDEEIDQMESLPDIDAFLKDASLS